MNDEIEVTPEIIKAGEEASGEVNDAIVFAWSRQ
jgi:hypothetical protein